MRGVVNGNRHRQGSLHVDAVEDCERRFAGRRGEAAGKRSDKFVLPSCNMFGVPLASRWLFLTGFDVMKDKALLLLPGFDDVCGMERHTPPGVHNSNDLW